MEDNDVVLYTYIIYYCAPGSTEPDRVHRIIIDIYISAKEDYCKSVSDYSKKFPISKILF